VIRANPDQSKHLETVAMTILGEPIDINCFRTDDYSQTSSSRIPSTRVGTATEDAHRRDFTLNALFFNVTESVRRGTSSTDACVEDLTGRGLDDLEHGLLRTPLAAFETLRDDPLRLLRGSGGGSSSSGCRAGGGDGDGGGGGGGGERGDPNG
jgi:tRNA nucleotidyltransferase (CCA-adding enzyme)